ncbi:MAG: class I SAM-dependent methyltransferase [Dehalococcoidia bacterium]
MTRNEINPTEVEAFARRLTDALNGAGLALMISVGHQTGLFDRLAELPPSTSEQIARAAGLQERYVREWLGAMVTGGIIEADRERQTYRLPPERGACLTRAAGPASMAALMQLVPLIGNVEDRIVACFRDGGGVPYSAYPRFHALMAELTELDHDASLIDGILPMAAGLIERLREGADVADIGCGHGHSVNLLARAFPASRFTGYDIAADALEQGRAEAMRWGLTNVRFVEQDVAALDLDGVYDAITAFDAIHDQARPRAALRSIHRALRPGSTFLMADIAAASAITDNVGHPLAPFLYTLSTMHCMTVSLADGGEGLGAMWGEEQARVLLAEAGFTLQAVKRLESDALNSYFIAIRP